MQQSEEVPPTIASRAVRERSARQFAKESPFVGAIRRLLKNNPHMLEAQDVGKLLVACAEAYEFLLWAPFWLKYLGYRLVGCPENISPLRLFVLLRHEGQTEEFEKMSNAKAVWGGLGLAGKTGVQEGFRTKKLIDLHVLSLIHI